MNDLGNIYNSMIKLILIKKCWFFWGTSSAVQIF